MALFAVVWRYAEDVALVDETPAAPPAAPAAQSRVRLFNAGMTSLSYSS